MFQILLTISRLVVFFPFESPLIAKRVRGRDREQDLKPQSEVESTWKGRKERSEMEKKEVKWRGKKRNGKERGEMERRVTRQNNSFLVWRVIYNLFRVYNKC